MQERLHDIPNIPQSERYAGTEPHASGGLYDDLLHEAISQGVEAGFDTAVRFADPIHEFSAYRTDKNIYGSMAGTPAMAVSRMEYSILNESARRAHVRVEEGSKIDDDEHSIMRWETSDTGARTVRYDVEGTSFQSELEDVIGEYRAPFVSIVEQLRERKSPAISEHEFSLDSADHNLDIVAQFMKLNITEKSQSKLRAKFTQKLYELPVRLPGEQTDDSASAEGVYFDEDGNLVKILRETEGMPGITVGMYFAPGTATDPAETTFRLGVELQPLRYVRGKNQRGNAEDDPFIMSQTGRALIDTIEQSGLDMSPRLKKTLTEQTDGREYDTRYGNGFAELTREIAKIVNMPSRLDKSTLFEGSAEEVASALGEINTDGNMPDSARAVFAILRQAGQRFASGEMVHASNLPVELRGDSMKAGSCKDAEGYYLSDIKERSTTVEFIGEDHTPMLRKKTGANTAVNLAEVRYNGITLPPGCLFQTTIREDGSKAFTFVRITGFAFDQATAQDAFGWQYTEARRASGSSASMESIAHRMTQEAA